MRTLRLICATACALFATAGLASAALDPVSAESWPRGAAVVSYESPTALARALARHPAAVVKRLPRLRVVVLRPAGDVARYATRLAAEPGIARVERQAPRRSLAEPALFSAGAQTPLQWQYAAIGADRVPPEVAAAAAGVTIAVVDTGADLGAPDLAAKAPATHSVRADRMIDATDPNGHGTFVSSLAAGSSSNGEGIAGVAGEAGLLVVQVGGPSGSFTDIEEAEAIVAAVDRGARIVNLSFGGPGGSTVERRAVEYAHAKGVLLVAAVGNGGQRGDPVEYPAALLQPPGSRGVGGRGLAVAASTRAGTRAPFSTSGTHVSLAAPGAGVFGAVSAAASSSRYPRTALPGSVAGEYGFGSGTSFAAPQVAGVAALVWAANPALTHDEVASILEETARGGGVWTPDLGYGVVDAAAAVRRAQGGTGAPTLRVDGRRRGNRVEVRWPRLPAAAAYRVTIRQNGGAPQVLTPATSATSAAYDLAAGSAYAFSVTALAADGSSLALSPAWRVSLRRAASTLELEAVRRGRSRSVSLVATLAVGGAKVAGRTVALDSHDGRRWTRSATGTTDAAGRARWRFRLKPGAYRVRARYAGTDAHAGAVSAPVALTIR